MNQLLLPFHQSDEYVRRYLRKATGKKISLVITDNSTSMLSVREKGGCVDIRLQRMFLSADKAVLDEIAGYVRNHRIKTPLVRKFIDDNTHELRSSQSRRVNLKAKGKYHNLSDIYNSVNSEYFENRVCTAITWGMKQSRRIVARRTLGSYSPDDKLIRINPVLDSGSVPKYFVKFIVYHEMLHADMGIGKSGKSRRIHTAEFKRRERLFRHFKRALAWEKKRWY
jgi:predicted metal-dependent hydrolase